MVSEDKLTCVLLDAKRRVRDHDEDICLALFHASGMAGEYPEGGMTSELQGDAAYPVYKTVYNLVDNVVCASGSTMHTQLQPRAFLLRVLNDAIRKRKAALQK